MLTIIVVVLFKGSSQDLEWVEKPPSRSSCFFSLVQRPLPSIRPKPPSPFPPASSHTPQCQWTLLNELISVSDYRNVTRRHKWGLILLEYIYMLKEFGNRKNFI